MEGDGVMEQMIPPIKAEDMRRFVALMEPVVAIGKGRHSIAGLVENLNQRQCQAWCIRHEGEIRSVGVTRLREYGTGLKVMQCEWGSGDKDDLKISGAFEKIEAIARRVGATRLQVQGRKGWLREFGPGWEEVSRTIEKEL